MLRGPQELENAPNRKIKKNKRCPTRLAVIRAYPSAYQSFPKIDAVTFKSYNQVREGIHDVGGY
jgi:hypothetical protein